MMNKIMMCQFEISSTAAACCMRLCRSTLSQTQSAKLSCSQDNAKMSSNRDSTANLRKINDSFKRCEQSAFLDRWVNNPGSKEAFQISIVSAVVTVIAFITGLSISISTHSSATLGYSLENLIDLISSLVVLWRFYGGDSVSSEELEKREKRASIGIAILMVILAICVAVAVEHLGKAMHQAHCTS